MKDESNELTFSLHEECVVIGFNELVAFILAEVGRQRPELMVENELNSADISFDVDDRGYPEMRILFNKITDEEKREYITRRLN